MKLEVPFGVELRTDNRWVILSALMPWEKIEERYAENFEGFNGQVAYSGRLAFGALYIQSRLTLTDDETAMQIQENPSMQFFCGYDFYTPEKPFDSSLMVHFRKRITAEMMKEIAEEAFLEEARKAIEKEAADKNEDANENGDIGGGNGNSGLVDDGRANKGTILLDATCCPSDIHYPTDLGLLNHGRELTEEMIDILYNRMPKVCRPEIKPRTYREVARKSFMDYTKKRRHAPGELRSAIRKQLECVRRNLDSIEKLAADGADLDSLGNELKQKLETIKEVYRQQKKMYDEKTNTVEDRIVSISQPYIRPIVRGKSGSPVEFGSKVATALIGGFTFIIHMAFDNFSEAKYLELTVEEYKRMFGFYPEVVIGDRAYPTNDNRAYCKQRGIRLSAQKRGRKTEEEKEAEKRQIYEDSCTRNAVEGSYGVGKRKYGLGLIMTKLFETTQTAISFGFFVKNMERVLRLYIFALFYKLRFFGNSQLCFLLQKP